MNDPVVGRINFDGTREGKALDVLREALIDRDMWESEYYKKDYECEKLREELSKYKKEEWIPEHPEGVNKEIVPCWGQTHLKMINRAHERIDEMKKTKRKRSAEKSCKKVRK